MMLANARPLSAPFAPACKPGKGQRTNHRSIIRAMVPNEERPETSRAEVNRRLAMTSSLVALSMAFTTSAQAAKEGKALKKKGASKGGLFNPAQRSQDLAIAEAQRKAELKEKYARLRAEGETPAPQ